MLADARAVVGSAWHAGLMPDPDINIPTWAAEHYHVGTGAEKGRWRPDRAPYMDAVLRWMSPQDDTEEVVIIKGGQISGSETANCIITYYADIAPGPMMFVQPTVDAAIDYKRERINPTFTANPRVGKKIKAAKSRDSSNTAKYVTIPGGFLAMPGANSAQALQSRAIKIAIADEVDRWPRDVDGQGDPLGMVAKRLDTYRNQGLSKFLKLSTPGNDDESLIQSEFLETDQHRIFLPCPHCGHMDYLRRDRLTWPKGRPDQAAIVCEDCGALIHEHHKSGMLARCEARPTAQSKRPRCHGISIPGLLSPWRKWADIAVDFDAAMADLARGSDAKLKKVVNLDFGDPYKTQAEEAKASELKSRAEPYPHRMVPYGGLIIGAAADVQHNRIEAKAMAWGRGEEAWVVDYAIFWGDTLQPAIWAAFDAWLLEPLRHQSGAPMRITACAIDSGDGTHTAEVYKFCRPRAYRNVFAVKGANSLDAKELAAPTWQEMDIQGKKVQKGIQLWQVGVHSIKNRLFCRLAVNTPGTNMIHFGNWLSEEYYDQLTSEKLVKHRSRGRGVKRWEAKPGVRNEAWDVLIYNYAAALRLGLTRWGEPKWLECEIRLKQADLIDGNWPILEAQTAEEEPTPPAMTVPAALPHSTLTPPQTLPIAVSAPGRPTPEKRIPPPPARPRPLLRKSTYLER